MSDEAVELPKSVEATQEDIDKVKQTDHLLEAQWRMGLPEVFRPVAERYGQKKFMIAWAIGSIKESCDTLKQRSGGSKLVQRCMFFIESGSNTLAVNALIAAGMNLIELGECQRDIERAAQLSAASTHNEDGNRIILPS